MGLDGARGEPYWKCRRRKRRMTVGLPGLVARLAGAGRGRDLERYAAIVAQPFVLAAMDADAFEDVVRPIAMAHHVMTANLPAALKADEIGHAAHVRKRQIDVQTLGQIGQRSAAEGGRRLGPSGRIRQAERFPRKGREYPCVEDRLRRALVLQVIVRQQVVGVAGRRCHVGQGHPGLVEGRQHALVRLLTGSGASDLLRSQASCHGHRGQRRGDGSRRGAGGGPDADRVIGHVVGIVSLGEFPLVQRLKQEIDDAGGISTGRDGACHGKADLVEHSCCQPCHPPLVTRIARPRAQGDTAHPLNTDDWSR